MKYMLIAIISILMSFLACKNGYAQIFYFEDTETTLDKETNHSPVHWYLEIYTTLEVDTTLRWKTTFLDIPLEWNVNIDCQTESFFDISDGDSADFTLTKMQDLINNNDTFPQKMIISASLNDKPGKGSVLFEVYDPENPSESEEIKFHFLIGLSADASIEESEIYKLISVQNGILKNKSGQQLNCGIYDVQGRTIFHSRQFNENVDLTKHKGEIVFIKLVDTENNFYQLKIVI